MRYFDASWMKASVASKMRSRSYRGTYDGAVTLRSTRYLDDCKAVHVPSGTVLIFTRDTGHHTSGWFKNPDYERCFHLSVSFRDPRDLSVVRLFDEDAASDWCGLFFGENRRYVWAESPKSPEGMRFGVWHYRVFCDAHWQPIIPRGEVYSTEFTEKGWKSWSELHGHQPLPGSGTLRTHIDG